MGGPGQTTQLPGRLADRRLSRLALGTNLLGMREARSSASQLEALDVRWPIRYSEQASILSTLLPVVAHLQWGQAQSQLVSSAANATRLPQLGQSSASPSKGAGRKRGGRRTDAACSNAYAIRIKVGSVYGRPRKLMPTGRSKA